jgi:hypothetical protein
LKSNRADALTPISTPPMRAEIGVKFVIVAS